MNRIKTMLRDEQPSFGAIVTMPSVQVIQVLAGAGLDWVIIDMEHGPIDLGAAHAMIAASAGTQLVPFVRVAWTHPWQAKPVLDLGALGVCFPMINDAASAEAAVRSLRYPPQGDRLWGPFYAPLRWGRSIPEYMAEANEQIMSIATIEHPDAIDHIDEIASVDGLDLAFIGPGDLATALEHPGQFDHREFLAAVAAAEAGLLPSHVAVGGVARSAEQAKHMIDRGYRALVLGFDWSLLHRATATFLDEIATLRG